MAVKITKEEVRHLAKLARLELSEEEVAKFTRELGSILEYVSKLQEVKTTSYTPFTYFEDRKNIFREDKVEKMDFDKELLFKNSPSFSDSYFKMRSVFKK